MPKIKTVLDLIDAYYKTHPNGHFFDRDTLAFFGEKRSDFYLSTALEDVDGHKCYRLRSYQRNAPGKPRKVWHYFDVDTLDPMHKWD